MAEFLDSMRRGIEKGVASIGAKSREVVETSQLRGQIRTLEDHKKARLEELGSIAHVMLTRGTLDEGRLREKSQALTAIEASIKEKEEQIRAIQARTVEVLQGPAERRVGQCACGGDLLEGARFCGRCGQPATPVAPAAPAQAPAICSHCGAPRTESTKFCAGCGNPV